MTNPPARPRIRDDIVRKQRNGAAPKVTEAADAIFTGLLLRCRRAKTTVRREWAAQLLSDYLAADPEGVDSDGTQRVIHYNHTAVAYLDEREAKFIRAMAQITYPPTSKQTKWLRDIFWRLQR